MTLGFVACSLTLGSGLKYICRNALASTEAKLESIRKSVNRVNISVVTLINIVASVDLALRQDSAQLPHNISEPAIMLDYFDRRLDWYLRITNAMLDSQIIRSTLQLPLSTELEQERRWFANQINPSTEEHSIR